MGYSKEIYKSAYKVLESRREKANYERRTRENIFFMRCPRAKEIKKLLTSTAIHAAKAVLNGSDTKKQLSILKEKNLELQKELSQLLVSCGFPENHLEEKYECEKCNDEGYIDGRMCSCFKKILKNEAYDRLNKLSPLKLCSFDSFSTEFYSSVVIGSNGLSAKKRMENIFSFCKNYAQNFSLDSSSIFMQGATGLGKTHLSLAIARTVIDKGYGVIFGSTQSIVAKLEKERFKYNRDSDDYSSEQYLIDCDLLILDDLGTEFSTAFSNSAIYNIVNSRMMANKPTIISTNLSLKELESSYSERFISRVMGNSIRLEYIGEDVRQKKAKRQLLS